MSEFAGEVRKNTIFPKGEDAVESTDLLRASYVTGTDDIAAVPDPRSFTGGLNGFETEAEFKAASTRPSLRPPR